MDPTHLSLAEFLADESYSSSSSTTISTKKKPRQLSLAEFLAEDSSSPSTILENLTNRAIYLLSSQYLDSPFFPAYFVPTISINFDGLPSIGLQSLFAAYSKTIQNNPSLRIDVLNSTVELKDNVGYVTCSVKGRGFAHGVTRAGTVMGKWSATNEGWRCEEWWMAFGMAMPA